MSMSKVNKYLLPCALFASIALTACGEAPQQQQHALPVDIFTVEAKDIPLVDHLTGRANPTRKAEVRPQVTGILQKRLFEEGSTVQQGQQLYQIDPSVYEANVKSAQASLASAKANLHSTQLRAERYSSLLKEKAVSKQEYDDAQASYLSAKASVQSAEAALSKANIDLAYTKVYAPLTGTINRSNLTEGALASVGQATPLTTIQQLDPMYVDLGQSSDDYRKLKAKLTDGKLLIDGKATVDVYFSDGTKYAHPGTLEFAEVSVDQSTDMVNLRAIVPNPDHVLLPGTFLRADINQGIQPNSLLVIANGVQREATGLSYAYVLNDKNIVERRNIKVGAEYDKYFVVTEGLKAGDRVITSNTQKIRDGMPVMPIDPNAQAQQQQQQAK